MAFAVVGLSVSAASAANGVNAKQCGVSDRADVQVNKKTDTVTVRGDTSTGGNNFYCYTNIPVTAGDTVTFDFLGTCGGGTPRVYLQFDGGESDGENTFDSGTCTQLTPNTGTVSYTLMKSGTVTAFAEIHDSDNGQTTYSNLIIAGTTINF
ncbi:hypothetical protein [Humibacillus xanthopallidus]|uniref:hypothetical protein n=1 Tax=Humibacillus xanthopallidus TaxID=412689 RepID=UPI00384BAD9B